MSSKYFFAILALFVASATNTFAEPWRSNGWNAWRAPGWNRASDLHNSPQYAAHAEQPQRQALVQATIRGASAPDRQATVNVTFINSRGARVMATSGVVALQNTESHIAVDLPSGYRLQDLRGVSRIELVTRVGALIRASRTAARICNQGQIELRATFTPHVAI
mgnify:CR=1 FL=1